MLCFSCFYFSYFLFSCVYKTARETLKMLTDHFIWFTSFTRLVFLSKKTFQTATSLPLMVLGLLIFCFSLCFFSYISFFLRQNTHLVVFHWWIFVCLFYLGMRCCSLFKYFFVIIIFIIFCRSHRTNDITCSLLSGIITTIGFFFFIMFSLNMFPPWNWRKVVLTLNSTSQVWRKNLGKKQIGALYMVSIVCITFVYSFLLYKLLRFFFCFTLLLVVTRFCLYGHTIWNYAILGSMLIHCTQYKGGYFHVVFF